MQKRSFFGRVAAATLVVFAGLTLTARAAGQEIVPAQSKIILLKPALRFVDYPYAKSDWRGRAHQVSYRPTTAELEEYVRVLIDAAKAGIGSKLATLDADKLEASLAEACSRLAPLASRLARGSVNEELGQELARLAKVDEGSLILAQFFRLDSGPPGSDSPASTLIQAALVSAKTGKVIWKGEQLIRYKALKPTDVAISKALTVLYRDFDIK